MAAIASESGLEELEGIFKVEHEHDMQSHKKLAHLLCCIADEVPTGEPDRDTLSVEGDDDRVTRAFVPDKPLAESPMATGERDLPVAPEVLSAVGCDELLQLVVGGVCAFAVRECAT